MTPFNVFEHVVRRAGQFSDESTTRLSELHPFDIRSIHTKLPPKVKKLFDDGHYSESTFEAFKFLDKRVSFLSGSKESGQKLMMSAFAIDGPIKINALQTESDRDEQSGFRFMLAGAMAAIRNPRGHEFDLFDPAETCLDYLSLVSLFIRKLEDANILI